MSVRVLVIDNYDSFTYNLVQRLGEIDPDLTLEVFRNDKITPEEIDYLVVVRGLPYRISLPDGAFYTSLSAMLQIHDRYPEIALPLSRVELEGASDTQQRIFYTALYHALIHPNVASDVDGAYLRFPDATPATAPPGVWGSPRPA